LGKWALFAIDNDRPRLAIEDDDISVVTDDLVLDPLQIFKVLTSSATADHELKAAACEMAKFLVNVFCFDGDGVTHHNRRRRTSLWPRQGVRLPRKVEKQIVAHGYPQGCRAVRPP
jgi:hypothetical protein